MNTVPEKHYDVIIAGAGPVGLFLATELALAQCSVLILEKAADPHSPLKRFPFGLRGLNTPSIEALYRRGLLHELEVPKQIVNPHKLTTNAQGIAPRHQTGHFAGIPLYTDNINTAQWKYRLPGAPATHLMAEMQELETVLSRRAQALGVTILRGVAITGVHQTNDTATVHAGELSFTGKWLAGCDGSRSVVRKAGGFEFAGTEPTFTGYNAMVDIADPEKLKPGRNLTAHGMYLQSQPGYLIIQDFDGGAFHQTGQPITAEHLQEVIRRISGTDVTINAVHIATTWTDRSRQATAYRNGRILLAGDAAHIHSPLGGQGLNLGLGDAMNLGWKLAATIHGSAPEGLLDTYHTERYPLGEQVLNWSRAQVAIMSPDPAARALNAVMRDLIDTPDGATYIAGRIWGIHTHYELDGHHPLIGHSVPDFAFENGTRLGEYMQDGKAILLAFDGHASLKAWAAANGDHVNYITGNVKDRLGIEAALIRPDGIIAWIAGNDAEYNTLNQVHALWVTPPRQIYHQTFPI